MCAPEEVSDLSIAEMVAQHSAKFKVYDDVISEMKAQLIQLLDQRPTLTQPLMSEVVAHGIAKEQPLREDIQPGVSPGRRQGGNNGPSRLSSVPMCGIWQYPTAGWFQVSAASGAATKTSR